MWRSFDVGAVVASLPDGAGSVVAGADAMTRPVRRARVITRPEALHEVGVEELIVATAATLASTGEPWDRLVTRLHLDHVAGIAVHVDHSGDLPAALLNAADQLALPVLAFTNGDDLTATAATVTDAVLEAQRTRLELVLDIHQRFTRIVAAGGGISEIASTLHTMVGFPVAVIDADEQPVALVPSDAAETLDRALASGESRSVDAGDHHYGRIVALTEGAALDGDGWLAVDQACIAVAVHLAQASAAALGQQRFAAISLEELISGHLDDPTDVVERAASFGWDLTRPRAVLLASVDPPTDDHLPAALATIAAAARATVGPDAIVWTRSATIAALIAPDTDAPAERRQIAERLRAELDRRLRTVTVSVGVGRSVDAPALLPRSYVEARRAVDVGRWAKGRHVTEVFDELGLERLLASTPTGELAEFVEHAIGPLIAHDQTHRTELVDTLRVWLDTRNMAEAARRTHVHYNTFKNRLDRVESILGAIVTEPARSLECEVAIYVARNHEGPWTTDRAER